MDSNMSNSDNKYTKLRWILTISGVLLYMVDIFMDAAVALKYYQEKNYVWSGLTTVFILVGLVVTQIFSYAWYREDVNNVMINPEGRTKISGMSKGVLTVLHLFGMGIFTRYYHLLKKGFEVVWTSGTDDHHKLFCHATDLSMLKMFEAFLESVPQLLLQLYIVLGHNESSVIQYLCMAFSFLNAAWALVDYRRCLRRSIPRFREMPSGLPTAVYLLYKLCTITSRILSYSLLLMLSIYSTIALTILWLLATIWTHTLQTDFCSTKKLEFLYRGVVGVILMFTFFNVKGQDTKVAMIVYYFFYTLMNILALSLLVFLKPGLQKATFFMTVSGVISWGSVLGLVSLVLYYLYLHPRGMWREADVVDGMGREAVITGRIKKFLQP
ncbi:XK-related protein 9 [Scomber scombrus]|uniref:XK-related protein n=1 Tax=Scomber scombrus TaxID=13677 RepID=A0AAV1PL27_SCOSC|nr:XK-related protein 9 [Scomber scombrus]XP_062297220.1 XK-related protein 9 [Scomber scombrus]XP_062297221.1 XK-related protein 9 [Scomber scombrus]